MMKHYVPPEPKYWLTSTPEKTSGITLDSLLQQAPPKPPASAQNGGKDILETIIEDKRNFLSGAINQLDYFRQERLRISQATKKKIDYDLGYNQYLIFELDIWPRGANSAADKRRGGLENIRTTLEQEKRREEVSCWQDLFKVAQDARTLLKEYMELKIKNKLLLDN